MSICVLFGFWATRQIIVQTDPFRASPKASTVEPAKSPRWASINGWSFQAPSQDRIRVSPRKGPNRHPVTSVGNCLHSQADASRIQNVPDFACPFSPFDDSWGVGGLRLASVQVTATPDASPSPSGPFDRAMKTAESFQTSEPIPNPPSIGVFLPCGAADAAEAARLRLRVELPPVPAYPADGEIPAELQHRLVFLDEETGNLVLSFPPDPDFDELELGKRCTGTG